MVSLHLVPVLLPRMLSPDETLSSSRSGGMAGSVGFAKGGDHPSLATLGGAVGWMDCVEQC
jgi:hypothetical protein